MAKKRKNRVRFARVPTGIDTCRFCAMLASRGAVYSSEDTAGKDIHENCHCTCVPSWGGSAIEGYDPDEYYDRWTHPEIYEGLDSIVANSLACLRVAEKRGFVKYDKPLLSFLKTEEDKRDLVAHAALVRNGRRFRALAEDAPEGFSNIDLEMDGVKYEVKSPDGANPRAVESNLRKAKKQFKKNYPEPIEDVRVIFNGVFYGQEDAFVASELAKRGREHSISEVIHVSKAGNIRGTWKAQTPSTERPGLQTRSSITHSASSMEEHRSPKPTTEVRSLGGVPEKGAIRGAELEAQQRMDEHARSYYEELRNRDLDFVVVPICEASGLNEIDARKAFNHLLVEEHDLDGGRKRFDPDYEIAQSIQRILERHEVLDHDRILFCHEALEASYMRAGKSYDDAHRLANLKYNYEKALDEWLDTLEF